MSHHPFSRKTNFIDYVATGHCTRFSAPLTDRKPLINAGSIYLTNGKTINASHTVKLLNLSMIDTSATTTQFNIISLISLGKLCGAGCEKKVTKKMRAMCKEEAPIITVPRCKTSGIHTMDITNLTPNVDMRHDVTEGNSSAAKRQSKISNIR